MKANTPGSSGKRRVRLHKGAAALTHAMFVLAIVLAVVKNEAPQAASPDAPMTAEIRPEQAHVEARIELPDRASREQVTLAPEADAAQPDMSESPAVEDRQTEEQQLAQAKPKPKAAPAPPATPPPASSAAAPAPANAEISARNSRLLDRLVAAYPDFLKGHDGVSAIWRDGARMVFDDGKQKSFEERLISADLEDAFEPPYPVGPMLDDPQPNFDPGRARNEAFFKKMYGDCKKKGEVQKTLVNVAWLPKNSGKAVKITSVNGVAEKLQKVSDELDALPKEFVKYLQPVAGTFNCRDISRTDRSSAHGFGISIDINAKYGDYWQWGKPKLGGTYSYRNQVPWEIAAIFEKHGFIWGAKWHHFDTMHFEYRPELIAAPDIAAGQLDASVPMPEKQPRNLN